MNQNVKTADDPRFHRTLFGALEEYSEHKPPALYYVENGNYIAGYDQLATDYLLAAEAILEAAKCSGWGNLTAPMVFVVRQTLELHLKALLEATVGRGNDVKESDFFSHKLDVLWERSQPWLEAKGYKYLDDARCETALWMLENFQAIDPTGDLFRFAHSKTTAFGRQKTYDRAGINDDVFMPYFQQTVGFLRHWTSVLVVEWIKEECVKDGTEYGGFFNAEDYPKNET